MIQADGCLLCLLQFFLLCYICINLFFKELRMQTDGPKGVEEPEIKAQLTAMNDKLDAIIEKLGVVQSSIERHDVPLDVMQNHVYNVESCMQRSMLAWPIRRLLYGWNFSFMTAATRNTMSVLDSVSAPVPGVSSNSKLLL